MMTEQERCEHCGVPNVADYWRHRDVVCGATVYLRRVMYDGPTKERIREIESFTQEYGPSSGDVYQLVGEVQRQGKIIARILEMLETVE